MTQSALLEEKKEIELTVDPSFSVIVPVYKVPEQVFKRCLLSISEQNYSNLEVILVFDGPDAKLKAVAEPFLTLKNWTYIEIEHKGACAARNAGFNVSKGEIVSFTNSDYILKRGVIRLWVDKLLENPDCGFVYSGYEYTTAQRTVYGSQKFDPYRLKVANYIDCGFPLWRKYVVSWDENCKSLQDWDFWLRVVDTHKVKGHYIENEYSFFAEPPRPKGLSMDSSSNWMDRVKYIKIKNHIPLNEMCVTSLGAPFHGIEIAKMLQADFRDDTIFKPHEYKALYMIGFYIKPNQPGNQHGPILNHFQGSKRIVHWVGADIYWLRKFSWEDLKKLGGGLQMSADAHLVENEQAKKELKDLLGIDAQVVPIPPYNDYEIKPLPEKFSVAVFMTEKIDFDKYYLGHTLSLIRAMPDIHFNIYGDYKGDVSYPNATFVGNLSKAEWKKFVYDNTCVLRLVRHDTTPLANNEFMLAGRYCVTNIPGEGSHVINTQGDVRINDWDVFQPGFSIERWPKTKKKIIQMIREIETLKEPYQDPNLKSRFDRDNYINTIYNLCNLRRPT